ncbi:MAG: PCI domain-containing protein [Terriglobus roseus]|nr:PCI domain-containing protein [Terriglobus roseus]
MPEIMRWPVVAETYGPHLASSDIFSPDPPAPSSSAAPATGGSGPDDGKAHTRWLALRKRVIEHNVRTVAKYYTRIRTARLAELLDLPEPETEAYISELVTGGTVYARIDRPAGVVSFARPRGADDLLNEWSGDMRALLGLLERIDHLITKEEMMARIQTGAAGDRKAKAKAG